MAVAASSQTKCNYFKSMRRELSIFACADLCAYFTWVCLCNKYAYVARLYLIEEEPVGGQVSGGR